MLVINISQTNVGNEADHCEALVARQCAAIRSHDTLNEYDSISILSTIVVLQEDWELWIHGTAVDRVGLQS